MPRLAGCALALAAACGTSIDDRPLENAYLTTAIFAPTCGTSTCHSSFRRAGDRVFDTPEATRHSLVSSRLLAFDSDRNDFEDPWNASLIVWITQIDPFEAGIGRMPYDAPMPNKDIELLVEWISHEEYGGANGASCNPRTQGGRACFAKDGQWAAVRCNDDWSFGDILEPCARGCFAGVCE
jgi:hypothetical protein